MRAAPAAPLCCRASVDAGIAVHIISRPRFEVSHNRGPPLDELQSAVVCVFISVEARYNTSLRPVSLPAGRGEFTPDGNRAMNSISSV